GRAGLDRDVPRDAARRSASGEGRGARRPRRARDPGDGDRRRSLVPRRRRRATARARRSPGARRPPGGPTDAPRGGAALAPRVGGGEWRVEADRLRAGTGGEYALRTDVDWRRAGAEDRATIVLTAAGEQGR